jgi:hypothetical protein
MMAKRWILALVILLLLGAGLGLGVYWAAPSWISNRLKLIAGERGFDLDAKVTELGISGMNVAIDLHKPFNLKSDLVITWDLSRFWAAIPFSLRSVPSARRDLVELPGGGRLKEPRFEIAGSYHRRDAVLEFHKIEVDLISEAPLRAQLQVRPVSLSDFKSWRAELKLEAQNFSGLGEARMSLKEAAKLVVLYRSEGDSHHLELEKDEAQYRLTWLANSSSKPLRLSLDPGEARVEFRKDGARPFVFATRYTTEHPLFSSAGKIEIDGTDFADFNLKLRDQARFHKWKEGDYQWGVGQSRLSLAAHFKPTRVSISSLTLKADLDQIQRKELVAQEISARLALRCPSLSMADFDAQKLGRDCRLMSDGVDLLVGRVFSKQPIRGLKLSLKPAAQIYAGQLGMEWQGARIESSRLEVEPSLSSLRLEMASPKLSLQELLTVLDQPKLSGQGEIKASLDLLWERSLGLSIRPAFFESTGPGILRYADPALHGTVGKVETFDTFQALLARGQQALVMKALEDFHYKKLKATVTRDPELKLRAELDLSGANPALAKSQPFEIHIPIEGDLESLLFNSLFADFSQRGMPAPRRLPKSTN